MTAPLEIELSLEGDGDLPVIIEQQPVEFVCLPPAGATLEVCVDDVVLSPFLRPGNEHWRWGWNPGACVGIHTIRLVVRTDRRSSGEHLWRLQVIPRKIDGEQYLALLEDVERVAPGLVRVLAGAAVEARLAHGEDVACSWIDTVGVVFGSSFDRFAQAVRRILASPRTVLRRDSKRIPLGLATGMSATDLHRALHGDLEAAPPEIVPHLQRAIHPEGGVLPRTVVQESSRDTYDTAEHRLLKHTLELARGRARRYAELAQRNVARYSSITPVSSRAARARAIATRCDQCAQQLADLLAAPFFAQVSALRQAPVVTPLIRRDPAYRQVYRMWRALHQGLIIDPGAPFDLSVVDLPLLYERWCLVQVLRVLLDLDVDVRFHSLLVAPHDDADAWSLSLRTDEPLLVAAFNGWTLTLRYQPRYRPRSVARSNDIFVSLDRYTRIPDIAIEMFRPDRAPRVIALDAKYRLSADGSGIPADALAEAYAYAGAIGVSGVPAVTAALILYPGTGAAERYPGGAGAVPLLPGAAGALKEALAAEIER